MEIDWGWRWSLSKNEIEQLAIVVVQSKDEYGLDNGVGHEE